MRCPNCDGEMSPVCAPVGRWCCTEVGCGYTEDRGGPPVPVEDHSWCQLRDGNCQCPACGLTGCGITGRRHYSCLKQCACGQSYADSCCLDPEEPEPYEYRCPACETSYRGLVEVCGRCGNETLEVLEVVA